jgi:hypothetical protein
MGRLRMSEECPETEAGDCDVTSCTEPRGLLVVDDGGMTYCGNTDQCVDGDVDCDVEQVVHEFAGYVAQLP